MVEADAENPVAFRLQREDATKFASWIARAKEAHALDADVKSWFERTKSCLARADCQTLMDFC
jgi:hypothetical protein